MGLAWGAQTSISIGEMVIMVLVSFTVINLSSAIGAQVNALSDVELDSKDDRKKHLVAALRNFGPSRLKQIILVEFVLAFSLVVLFTFIQQNFVLLLLWLIGIGLGSLYSLPPIRLKARSWMAPVSLMLVLAIFPVLFSYFTFTTELNPFFVLSLIGLPLTIYSVIIPTEIRDYFGDKAMGIETMTVHIGLVHASLLSMILLSVGAFLTALAFLFQWTNGGNWWLNLFLLAIPIVIIFVLRKFKRLYTLSTEYEASRDKDSVTTEIVNFSSNNPQWIMLVTQTYSALSITLLISKFLL